MRLSPKVENFLENWSRWVPRLKPVRKAGPEWAIFFSRKKIRPTLTLSLQTENKIYIVFRLVSTCTSCRGQVSPLSSQGWTCNLGGTGEAWRRLKKNSKLGIQKNTNRCSLHCPRRVWHLVEQFSNEDFSQAMISEPSGPPANQNHCVYKWSSYSCHFGLQE